MKDEKSKMTDEEFYDMNIAPRLKGLGLFCKERGMPFLAAVQFNNDDGVGLGVARTQMLDPNDCMPQMVLAYLSLATRGNIDAMVSSLLKAGHPHNSIVLHLMKGNL